ncbi:MAG: proteasome-activating nucleotidase [Thermoplasmata archaeon]|nr:proteasome-activating nucleotidase [Thermoplasmata archaeon]
MTETEKRGKVIDPIGIDDRRAIELGGLEEEIKVLKGQLRSVEYSSNLEREAFKRELTGAYDEINMLRRDRKRLNKQLEELMKPPLLVGEVVEILDDGEVIVKNGNGQIFITTVSSSLKVDDLEMGTRVGLDRNNLVVMRGLSTGKDPIIVGAEIILKPDTTYGDIGGLDDVITEVKETVELPIVDPKSFTRLGIHPPNGILLVGPPGTGKTLIAKAVANAAECSFIRLVGSELVQKFIGEGGRLVRELFQLAREKKPTIIFIDEIDAIGAKRLGMDTTGDREVQRTLMQLLAELDGFNALEDIGIIAATNRKDILDEALLRPGRFDRIIEVPIPNDEGRRKILQIHMEKLKLARDVNMERLIPKTEGFTGADIRNLCMEAGMFAMRNRRNRITAADFTSALEKLKKRAAGADEGATHTMFG